MAAAQAAFTSGWPASPKKLKDTKLRASTPDCSFTRGPVGLANTRGRVVRTWGVVSERRAEGDALANVCGWRGTS
jgi:hypothetical protein